MRGSSPSSEKLMANLLKCAQTRKSDLRPAPSQTGHKIRTGNKQRLESVDSCTPNGSRRSHRRQPQDLSLPAAKNNRRHKREVEDDGAVRTVPRHGGKSLTCPLLYAQLRAVYQKTLIFPNSIYAWWYSLCFFSLWLFFLFWLFSFFFWLFLF